MRFRRARLGPALIIAAMAACGPDGPVELPRALPGSPAVEYPVELWDLDLEGETTVMVLVNEQGTVDSVFVDESSGFEEFDSAAVRGARRMRYDPGRRDGERISVWVRLPVRFEKTAGNGRDEASTTGS